MPLTEIPGFPGYYATEDGTIWSRRTYSGKLNGDLREIKGWIKTGKWGGHRWQSLRVDGIKTDNRLENLRWDTRKANVQDSIRLGIAARGERSGPSKLTELQVREAHEMRVNRKEFKSIANRFGVTSSAIQAIAYGKSWGHLGLPQIRSGRKWSTS